MLQIDHVYEFLYQELFKDFTLWYLKSGVPNVVNPSDSDISVFTQSPTPVRKIFLYDQEPFLFEAIKPYLDVFLTQHPVPSIIATSEISQPIVELCEQTGLTPLYYFFHGFAALDWYRGFHALNYNKSVITEYHNDFVSYNRLISEDRSYRIYFISLLQSLGLLNHGTVSFNVVDDKKVSWREELADPLCKLSSTARTHIEKNLANIDQIVADNSQVHGSASADIPRSINVWLNPDIPATGAPTNTKSFWHIVTETVFYYPKLHLTEKIFKPIVSKQPFMLLAAPGNLEYLKSYGFKTFSSVIDESYDDTQDHDLRTEAVVKQLQWYCGLSDSEKQEIIKELEPIIEHNFHHFYGDFKNIITTELITNCKQAFKNIGYNDNTINYSTIQHVLTK